MYVKGMRFDCRMDYSISMQAADMVEAVKAGDARRVAELLAGDSSLGRSRTPDGVWTKPGSLDDAFSPQLGYARCVQPAFGPAGDLFVVWYQDTGSGEEPRCHPEPA